MNKSFSLALVLLSAASSAQAGKAPIVMNCTGPGDSALDFKYESEEGESSDRSLSITDSKGNVLLNLNKSIEFKNRIKENGFVGISIKDSDGDWITVARFDTLTEIMTVRVAGMREAEEMECKITGKLSDL